MLVSTACITCRLSPASDADRQTELTDAAAAIASDTMRQTEQEPTVDQQDLQQQQVQQVEAGTDKSRQEQQQQQQLSPAETREAQLQQQEQQSKGTQEQQQQRQQQATGQQGSNEAGAGIAAAGLTVEQAADKTHEHAMAAMMGGPPQWGGRFDNRLLPTSACLHLKQTAPSGSPCLLFIRAAWPTYLCTDVIGCLHAKQRCGVPCTSFLA